MIRIHADTIAFDLNDRAINEALSLISDRSDAAFWLDAYFASFGETEPR